MSALLFQARPPGRKGARLCLGVAFMLLVAAFIEAFWSSTQSIPAAVKYSGSWHRQGQHHRDGQARNDRGFQERTAAGSARLSLRALPMNASDAEDDEEEQDHPSGGDDGTEGDHAAPAKIIVGNTIHDAMTT